MKSALLTLYVLIGALNISAQITLQNPNYRMSDGIQAPRPMTLQDLRNAEQLRIQQQNAMVMQQMQGNSAQNSQQHIQGIMEEIKEGERQNQPVNYEFPEFQQHSAQYFKQTFAELQNMLEGKQDLSLKRAVFLAENAFLENSLSYDWFCNDIATELDIFQSFMKKEKLDINSDMAKKYMLQKFFSDTLTMRNDKGKYQFTHYPYKYDFEDPFGKKDWRKMFVTKLLRDKKGQCHSMPLLYLIFAEELNVKAWLSYSPQHSYIKTQDNKGIWYNFETTNGHYSSDSWLLSSGYVKVEALRNQVFMDTLSQKSMITACFADLAKAYIEKFGYDKFVLSCVNKTLEHNPKNVFALQLKANYYTYLFQYVAKQLNFPPKDKIYLYPKANNLLQKVYESYALIDQPGFELMPENMYQAWLESFDKEKNKQPVNIIKP